MNKLWQLFKTFFIIGSFTIGGGYAMLPLFEEEFVHKKKWFTDEDYLDMLTIVTSAPGPLAVNSAVYTGFHLAGVWGSIAAVLGVIIPPTCIILIIVPFYHEVRQLAVMEKIFKGIRPAVVGLIIAAVYRLYLRTKMKKKWIIVPITAFLGIAIIKIDPIIVIVLLAFSGLLKSMIVKE
ncbi:MAG: chromate transporter [Eubacteriales bacterium]